MERHLLRGINHCHFTPGLLEKKCASYFVLAILVIFHSYSFLLRFWQCNNFSVFLCYKGTSNQIFPSAASAVDGKGLINYIPQTQFNNKIPFLAFNFWCNFISFFPFPGVDFLKNEKEKKSESKKKLRQFVLHREFLFRASNISIYLKIGFSSERWKHQKQRKIGRKLSGNSHTSEFIFKQIDISFLLRFFFFKNMGFCIHLKVKHLFSHSEQ